MNILGIAAWFHDSSAALLRDGELVAYAEEERFNREKHTNAYPQQAVDWVLGSSGLSLDQVDEVAFYVNPRKYVWTGLKAVAAHFPSSLRLARRNAATMSPLVRLAHIARLKSILRRRHRAKGNFKVVYVDHYRTHQASTFFASGFDDAAVLTMDFAVDGTTEVIAHGRDRVIEDKLKHGIPNGFAIIYAAVTHVLGFKFYDEYKVMGMAAFGQPRYIDQIRKLYSLNDKTGELTLNLQDLSFHTSGRGQLTSQRMNELLGPPRHPAASITQREYDLAASLQTATNEYGIAMAAIAKNVTGSRNLCMAGGVAQNCLMNQAICESGLFENVSFSRWPAMSAARSGPRSIAIM